MPTGSQKAGPEWAGRRSGKAPWKIPLDPPIPKKALVASAEPPLRGYISVSLSRASFSEILSH